MDNTKPLRMQILVDPDEHPDLYERLSKIHNNKTRCRVFRQLAHQGLTAQLAPVQTIESNKVVSIEREKNAEKIGKTPANKESGIKRPPSSGEFEIPKIGFSLAEAGFEF